ncbi:MAG: RNA polymerase factor sigma-54 [Spirochaetaceae bacterium]|nr:RNA polymerase factor sigma-54 [Spirochaetaceae bacterium]
MQLGFSLEQKQQQAISQELVQSLRMLSLSTIDLREHIFSELQQNPILEIVKDPLEKKQREKLKGNYTKSTRTTADEHQRFLESIPDTSETLQEHLLKQFRVLDHSAQEKILGEMLIQNINELGFHNEAPQEILRVYNDSQSNQKLTKTRLETILKEIQNLDPIGCCTKDSIESLQVQTHILYDKMSSKSIMYKYLLDILDNHKELFKLTSKTAFFHQLKTVSPEYSKIKLDTANEILDIIANLSPAPGKLFTKTEKTNFIIPEVFVYKTEDGFKIEINSTELPVLSISETVTEHTLNTSKELKSALARANQFIENLEYRRKTILKLVNTIVTYQKDFFTFGVSYLKPLSQKELAEQIKVHPSTISRSVNGKYLQCDWGIFELRYFFSNTIVKSEQNQIYKNEVLHTIHKLITENPKVTDAKICEMLQEQGISISRRTVNKYRKQLETQMQ